MQAVGVCAITLGMRFSGFGVVPSDVALGGLWLQTGRFRPSGMLRALREIVVLNFGENQNLYQGE